MRVGGGVFPSVFPAQLGAGPFITDQTFLVVLSVRVFFFFNCPQVVSSLVTGRWTKFPVLLVQPQGSASPLGVLVRDFIPDRSMT